MTKGLANEMLGELKNLPIISIPADPEHRDDDVSDIPQNNSRVRKEFLKRHDKVSASDEL